MIRKSPPTVLMTERGPFASFYVLILTTRLERKKTSDADGAESNPPAADWPGVRAFEAEEGERDGRRERESE